MPLPLVSCIMPTANRRAYVPHAIDYFLSQDYAERELVILDDGEDCIADLVSADPRIRYLRETTRRTVGTKRNACNEAARGEIIVHWDDDDWMSPRRISTQVDALVRADADLCGCESLLFFDPAKPAGWLYRYPGTDGGWVCGNSMAYRRDLWRRNRFPDLRVGEDSRFIWSAKDARVARLGECGLMVGLVHPRNTSPRRTRGSCWQAVPIETVRGRLGGDWARYVTAAALANTPRTRTAAPASAAADRPTVAGTPVVTIGIHVCEEPVRLAATLRALRANTEQPVRIVLLADALDELTGRAVAATQHVEVVTRTEPAGAPRCFNDLLRGHRSDIYVFLESGAQVTPGWLPRLLEAFADPGVGLAGPSTNRHWSLQGAFAGAGDAPEQIARTAQAAAARFGRQVRSLEPLHCLGDFCFAVRRAVVDAIGGADEGYGLGPCWEMDYAARAARAGFRAVWVGGAYVHRLPFGPRRSREEPARFLSSRQRYQDRLCGLRLSGERDGYVEHCRGEACPHFAPRALIELVRPLDADAASTWTARPAPEAAALPLASCIMVTGDRRDWALQAIRYFARQDYPAKELVIVDDGREPLEAALPCDHRIRYLRLSGRASIGAKRNRACEIARGTFVVHWDDDDWHGPDRLSRQIAPLAQGRADITALRNAPFFDVQAGIWWGCSRDLHRRLFVLDVHGGTLAYRRSLFSRALRFPDRSLAEDAVFLRRAVDSGARLERLAADGAYVYVRHGANSWRVAVGRQAGELDWLPCEPPVAMLPDMPFYARYAR